jgi:hypothetical protein
MMKHSPFQTKKRTVVEIEAIGDESTGIIYLAKRGGITPAENPVDLQESIKRESEATLIFLEAVKACAVRHGISNADARKRIFPEPTPDKTLPDGTIVKGVAVDGDDLYDYLEPSEIAQLISLQSEGREVALQAATLFIQRRMAYPIVVTENAKAKLNQIAKIAIEPLRYQVVTDNNFKLGETIIAACEPVGFDAETLMTSQLPRDIAAGEVGYLLDVSGQIKIGDPNWTLEDTRSYLQETQINAIYNFYQSEIGRGPVKKDDADGEENLKMLSPSSPSTSSETPSTGVKSIGASKATASVTIDSTPKTLAISQTG